MYITNMIILKVSYDISQKLKPVVLRNEGKQLFDQSFTNLRHHPEN